MLPFSRARRDIAAVLVLGVVWIVMILGANPSGDFPLNDDWIYGGTVKSIVAGNGFRMAGPTIANLFVQAYWGALFCLPFGFSFVALRASTLVLGLLGLVTFYALAREMGASRTMALAAALTLAANPLFFDLANTFMTDVPFLTLALMATYAFVRGLSGPSPRWLAAGIVVALIAILLRQVGITLLVAFAVAYPVRKGFTRSSLLTGMMAVLPGIVVHFAYQRWLIASGQGTELVISGVGELLPPSVGAFIGKSARYSIFVLPYVGAGLLPFVIATLTLRQREAGKRNWRGRVLIGVISGAIFAGLWWKHDTLPVLGNVLMATGIGPLTQRDTYLRLINLPPVPPILAVMWIAMTGLGVTASVWVLRAIVARIWRAVRQPQSPEDSACMFVLVLAVAYWGMILVLINGSGYFFDRYLLPLVPLMIVLVPAASIPPRPAAWRCVAGGAPIFAMALASVLATHDYLAWNRARWAVLADLTGPGAIAADRIDGGYEFNGTRLYDPHYRPSATKSYWWVRDDEYVLASGPMTGYRTVSQRAVDRWLPIGPDAVLVLHRQPPPP